MNSRTKPGTNTSSTIIYNLNIVFLNTGTVFAFAVYVMQDDPKFSSTAAIVGWIGRLFPTYGLAKSTMTFVRLSTLNSQCNVLTDDVKDILCKPSSYFSPSMRACCGKLGIYCIVIDELSVNFTNFV